MTLSLSHIRNFEYTSLCHLAPSNVRFSFIRSSVSLRRQPKEGVSHCACVIASTIVKIRTNVNKQVKFLNCAKTIRFCIEIFTRTYLKWYCIVRFCATNLRVSILFCFFSHACWSRRPALILSSRIGIHIIPTVDNDLEVVFVIVGRYCFNSLLKYSVTRLKDERRIPWYLKSEAITIYRLPGWKTYH